MSADKDRGIRRLKQKREKDAKKALKRQHQAAVDVARGASTGTAPKSAAP